MIFKLNNEDAYMACGTVVREPQVRYVGDKNTPVASFSLACGKKPDTTTIFVECKAWRALAEYSADLKKGDQVLALGKIESREYNGKVYKDLVCEWVWGAVPPKLSTRPIPEGSKAPEFSDMMAATDDDLPF